MLTGGSGFRGRRIALSKLRRGCLLLLLALLGTACSGGSSHGSTRPDPAAATAAGSNGSGEGGAGNASDRVAVSGVVTFDLVPVSPTSGLDYAHIEAAPARGVTVQAVDAADTVLASTTTDAEGRYTLELEPDLEVLIRARAEMSASTAPSWNVKVVDNTASDSLYVLDTDSFSTGTADQTRNLHAAAGWDASLGRYNDERAAAPFAILDVVYDALQFVGSRVPVAAFPALTVHWSPKNVPNFGDGGRPDPATGEIGTSYYDGRGNMYVLGAADSDTDEYDRHVIMHELGHYLEDSFWRSDSIGGPHSPGDQLDPRTAFSEGWGNAFSGMATGDSLYVDTMGPKQSEDFSFDVEGESGNAHPGWFSEESVEDAIYDLYDDVQDTPQDSIALGFAPIFTALVDHVGSSRALTSLFPLVAGLRADLPAQAKQIDALLETESISPIDDDYGTGRTNAGQPTDGSTPAEDAILPIYKPLTANGPAVKVCSSDAYESPATGAVNKLGSRAFLHFTAPVDGRYLFEAVTASMPDGAAADPDMILHGGADFAQIRSKKPPDAAVCSPELPPAGCSEQLTSRLARGDYVLEVYEWTNTEDRSSDHPPIGLTCFDVTAVTQ